MFVIWFVFNKVLNIKINKHKYVVILFFVFYLLVLYQVLFGISGGIDFNVTRHKPNFYPIIKLLSVYDMGIINMGKQVALNIVILIPFGFFLPWLSVFFHKTLNLILGVTLFSFLIELLQYFMGRSADIDDIIMNTIGGIVGYILFFICKKVLTKHILRSRQNNPK
jgi:glycopeptide antibiotics resistance protein